MRHRQRRRRRREPLVQALKLASVITLPAGGRYRSAGATPRRADFSISGRCTGFGRHIDIAAGRQHDFPRQ